ncbi:MAG: PLP-dependent aminotransferase family protein [Clostridiales bacterium]|jgi:2-aminoadipate transaminase|nr:PLP-dependent aminotransferase family protein [Clostridiales bacterium]
MSFNYSERMNHISGSATREILKLTADPTIISFAGGLPAADCLPFDKVGEISDELLRGGRAEKILQYGITQGLPSAREAMIEYVKKAGVKNITLEQSIVLSGGQQGIDLMCKVFLSKGDTLLVENPTYLAVLPIAAAYEANVVGVNSGEDGLDIQDLEAKINEYKPKLLYVVPTFSNPTGRTYSLRNRIAIACLTAKHKLPVLEDDPYSKLRFEGEYVPALKSVDVGDNVVYLTSFSKIVSPGLRVAVAVGNKEIISKLEITKQGADVHTSHLSQAIVEEYLRAGYIDKQLKKITPIYKAKKDCMISAINKYMPEEFKYSEPQGGLFIWGALNADIDTEKLFPEAIARKVAYVYGNVFFADDSGHNTLRLNFSNATPERIDIGMHALGDLLKEKIKGDAR